MTLIRPVFLCSVPRSLVPRFLRCTHPAPLQPLRHHSPRSAPARSHPRPLPGPVSIFSFGAVSATLAVFPHAVVPFPGYLSWRPSACMWRCDHIAGRDLFLCLVFVTCVFDSCVEGCTNGGRVERIVDWGSENSGREGCKRQGRIMWFEWLVRRRDMGALAAVSPLPQPPGVDPHGSESTIPQSASVSNQPFLQDFSRILLVGDDLVRSKMSESPPPRSHPSGGQSFEKIHDEIGSCAVSARVQQFRACGKNCSQCAM